MKKVAVVYWSGTGNTELMAKQVKVGAKEKGAEVSIFTSAEFSPNMINDFDAFAFGCSSMGDEVLEEGEFQPMWDSVIGELKGKKVALFGSYGWGDGEWMRNWEKECGSAGISLACDCVICNYAPDSTGDNDCKALGATLAL